MFGRCHSFSDEPSTVVTTSHYVYGLDSSSALQGIGGIGGLLAANLDGIAALYCYDANGNVGQLVSADGSLSEGAAYHARVVGKMVKRLLNKE